MEELKARVNVILKSLGKIKDSNILQFKNMEINMKTKKVFINDKELELNEKLFNLLEYLVINKGVVFLKSNFLIIYVDIIVMHLQKL